MIFRPTKFTAQLGHVSNSKSNSRGDGEVCWGTCYGYAAAQVSAIRQSAREREGERQRGRERERERECERERERERERQREKDCLCVCQRERERERALRAAGQVPPPSSCSKTCFPTLTRNKEVCWGMCYGYAAAQVRTNTITITNMTTLCGKTSLGETLDTEI